MKYLKLFEDFNIRNLFKSKEKENLGTKDFSKSNIMIDIREFTKTKGPTPYMSYLNIEKYVEKEPIGELCKPNREQMRIIDEELNKNYLSPNLMDDTITFREFLKEKGIL